MKKIAGLFAIISLALTSNAQVTSLNENFNTSCASATGFPTDWTFFNPIIGTYPSGVWTCDPTDGRDASPGIACTGTYSGSYHLDTSLLVTPELNLSGYTGNIYMQFDSRTEFLSGGRLTLIVSYQDSMSSFLSADTAFKPTINPIIAPPDSLGWVTHQIDLTSYKSSPIYVGFMYSSPNTFGTKWFLDNIFTTTTPLLGVVSPVNEKLPLAVIGNPTNSEIKLSYYTATGGQYKLTVYDMMGRAISSQTIDTHPGSSMYTINGLDLLPGIFIVRMGNGTSFGSVKVIVE
jgi:hypothetical protein